MRTKYKTKGFSIDSLSLIADMDQLITEYQNMHMTLTLRQLYYRLVAGGKIPNTQKSYSRVGRALSDARLDGLIDWAAIVDRGRSLSSWASYDSVDAFLRSVQYRLGYDHWAGQDTAIEVWVEKEALIAVVARAAASTRTPHFACKGYVSQSALHGAALRIRRRWPLETTSEWWEPRPRPTPTQRTCILYLGDHDPSGLDMPRDIRDRLATFGVGDIVDVERIALTAEQIDEHNPPPNPAKTTDSRFKDYQRDHGDESWELDALEPQTLITLISGMIHERIDTDAMDRVRERESADIDKLGRLAERYAEHGWEGLGIDDS